METINTDNLFIPKAISIKKCLYCNAILLKGMPEHYRRNSYCSQWCYEMENVRDLEVKEHVCKCGEPTKKTLKKDGTYSRTFRLLCDECFVRKYGYDYEENKRTRETKASS